MHAGALCFFIIQNGPYFAKEPNPVQLLENEDYLVLLKDLLDVVEAMEKPSNNVEY